MIKNSLADTEPAVFWTSRGGAPEPLPPVRDGDSADLVIVGGGFTGLWAAVQALQDDPGADVLILEAAQVGYGASGRNGGFVSESLTHGIGHGQARWPGEQQRLIELGRRNVAEIVSTLTGAGIDADLRLVGKTTMATAPHHVGELAALAALYSAAGDRVTLLSAEEARADVHSPTYLGGLRIHESGGLVDPAALTYGLARLADSLGARRHDRSPVTGLRADKSAIEVTAAGVRVRAEKVLIATNAYPSPLRRVRPYVLPVYDHVLVTEPLSAGQWAAVGWAERQGLTDNGNQFHYYRPTADGRILWGGYDAIYHFGGRVRSAYEQRAATHELLARHFFETFPQLEGLRFTHRWGGVIDSTSRFTPIFGTAHGGRVAYAVGYTGLGVASSRFGARVALDLLSGRSTELTGLSMVRRRGIPFPPEPVRWPVVALTRQQMIRADANGGRRGAWLRLLDRFGVGFDS
ncbi:oxidoreductase [Paractinoplanes abujensis]|uniref:Glycine/D-amino acid oxidase-like deaminating enzyme n=1 Tax=Paractinoplanes abujensis TaxID=882441 RepID=A0A7W7CSQ1_9ACTN|nr:FAD-binding oxidoreductase [Actinoplanes abujensis]MBB4694050.1 glycine/D-amino acid oxidase-like deaminating enzyme [Actinoplanes abujensis]GID20735.1 oxidoreductase [Actinoplanes abujensis]